MVGCPPSHIFTFVCLAFATCSHENGCSFISARPARQLSELQCGILSEEAKKPGKE